MAKATIYNYTPGTTSQEADDLYSSVGSATFILGTVKRAFKGGGDIIIRTASGGGGTLLVLGTDYTLQNEDFTYTALEGYQAFTGVKVVNAAYQAVDLYVTYKVVGTYTDATVLNATIAESGALKAERDTLIGEPIMWLGRTLPSANFLWLTGSSISRATYSVLWAKWYSTVGAFTVNAATPAVFTLNAHGRLTGECVSITTTGSLYTGIVINTQYFVEWINADTFYLHATADSARLGAGGSRIATSGAQSGTHTLMSNPWGFSASDTFHLPNFSGLTPRSAGTQSINTRAKTGSALGVANEDRFQTWQIGQRALADNKDYYASLRLDEQRIGLTSSANQGGLQMLTTSQGAASRMKPYSDGTNGTPRTGDTTRINEIGVNYIVRAI